MRDKTRTKNLHYKGLTVKQNYTKLYSGSVPRDVAGEEEWGLGWNA